MIVREHFMAIDIPRTMQMSSKQNGAPGAEAVAKVAAALAALPKPAIEKVMSPNILMVAGDRGPEGAQGRAGLAVRHRHRRKDIVNPNYLPADSPDRRSAEVGAPAGRRQAGGFFVSLAPTRRRCSDAVFPRSTYPTRFSFSCR